jgi:3-hydroxyacyl-CoA dehydrogenase
VLEDGVAAGPRDVDLALIYGIGFPPFRGGLLFWADRVGAGAILEKLKPLESLGPRYTPTQMLKDLASSGSKFYD